MLRHHRAVDLLQEIILSAADLNPAGTALAASGQLVSYETLVDMVERACDALIDLQIARGDRVAVFLDKQIDTVVAIFAIARAGAAVVPVNPVLKSAQVMHILKDCNVCAMITTAERSLALRDSLSECPDLRHLLIVGPPLREAFANLPSVAWSTLLERSGRRTRRVIDEDIAAIFYTSGSTGRPKGVVVSHRNLVVGARSVANYLENSSSDVILSALPLSFDAGFSQLTTGFLAAARVVLLNYLAPRDVVNAIAREGVTGLTAVPPLWIQLTQADWPDTVAHTLRYIANTGGRMPQETLRVLRSRLPQTKIFLMYGLTEAFRSTYLPPDELDRRPTSIGKAIPNAEILVLRQDGTPCEPHEPGELVHRGALVALGYWNDPVKTAERYKPLPPACGVRPYGVVPTELAVFSGDIVTKDEEGFLYFIGRNDEMIKTSGYRVSPTEVEEMLYATRLVGEVAAFGIDDASLGQAIVVVATSTATQALDVAGLTAECRKRLPAYMVPSRIIEYPAPLPRNPNGKIDRKLLAARYLETMTERQT